MNSFTGTQLLVNNSNNGTITIDNQQMQLFSFIYFNQLYMFRAMFSPVIRSVSL